MIRAFLSSGVQENWWLFAWAVLLNSPWEIGQAVAYTGTAAST